MFSPKVKLDRSLYDRIAQAAEQGGCSSAQEFVIHVLEREVAALEQDGTDQQVDKQLRGLGYIE